MHFYETARFCAHLRSYRSEIARICGLQHGFHDMYCSSWQFWAINVQFRPQSGIFCTRNFSPSGPFGPYFDSISSHQRISGPFSSTPRHFRSNRRAIAAIWRPAARISSLTDRQSSKFRGLPGMWHPSEMARPP